MSHSIKIFLVLPTSTQTKIVGVGSGQVKVKLEWLNLAGRREDVARVIMRKGKTVLFPEAAGEISVRIVAPGTLSLELREGHRGVSTGRNISQEEEGKNRNDLL